MHCKPTLTKETYITHKMFTNIAETFDLLTSRLISIYTGVIQALAKFETSKASRVVKYTTNVTLKEIEKKTKKINEQQTDN